MHQKYGDICSVLTPQEGPDPDTRRLRRSETLHLDPRMQLLFCSLWLI
jgi:hypothetical protein